MRTISFFTLLGILWANLAGAVCRAPAEEPDGEKDKSGLVVHEWGVLIRQNTFPATVGAAEELLESLPDFVGLHSTYKPEQHFRPWTKPVLHFYGREQEVSVEILTPTGRPAAYWPMPALVEEVFWQMGSGLEDAVGMRWEGKVRDEPVRNTVRTVAGDHWWNKVREIDGLWFEMGDTSERFIFYEGTGHGEPTVTAQIDGDRLLLINRDDRPADQVLVIINDGETRYLRVIDEISARGVREIHRDDLLREPVDRKAIETAARNQWVTYGMTEQEARVIASVWAEDLWENKGFLIVSRMPNHIYDRYIFPLKIEPEPDELVRAAVVFDTLPMVPGRLRWLPKLVPQIEELLKGLGAAEPAVREEASSKLASYGDLARDILEENVEIGDLESRMRVKSLLDAIEPRPPANLPTHLRGSAEGKITNDVRLGPPVEIEGVLKVVGDGDEREIVLVHELYGEIKLGRRFPWPIGDAEKRSGEEVRLKGRFVPPWHNYYSFDTVGDSHWRFETLPE